MCRHLADVYKRQILLFFMLGCLVIESKAQKIAVKSNLLYDATTTVNLGLEFGLARKWTLDIPVNYNPWKPDNGRRLRHWGVQQMCIRDSINNRIVICLITTIFVIEGKSAIRILFL